MENTGQLDQPKLKNKKKFKIPTPYTIIFFLVVFVVLLTWILHWAGVTYTHTETTSVDNGDGTNKIIETTTTKVVSAAGIIDIFTAPFVAFGQKADILVFILAIGSFSFLVMESKSLEAVTQKLVKKMGDHSIWLIPIMTIMLSFFGSTYGMCEESLGFLFVLCPLMLSTGFDVVTALLIVIMGVDLGTMMATTDPFLISAAVKAASDGGARVAFADGIEFRIIAWVIITAFSCVYISLYALRVKKNPKRSVVFNDMEGHKQFFLHESTEGIALTKRKIWISVIYIISFFIMIAYLISWDALLGYSNKGDDLGPMMKADNWMQNHLPYLAGFTPGLGNGDLYYVSGIFLIASLIVGILTWTGEENFNKILIDGAKDVLGVIFMISLAGSINVILAGSGISEAAGQININGLNAYEFIILSFLIFIPLSFAIPSTSGFATAIFPIWGKVAGQVTTGGVSAVSGSITAFSFASGWANLFSPATGLVMGGCSIAKINYVQFLKAIWPAMLITFVMNILLLLSGVSLNTTGFHFF